MSNISNIAKISVEKHDSKDQILYDLDKSKTLCEIIRDICKTCGLPMSTVYGLKLINTNINDPTEDTYICNKNYKSIVHNNCLKIVFSIDYLLKNRILPHINDAPDSIERAISYDDLIKLAQDPVFIDELVEKENHRIIIDTYINDENLQEKELLTLLITLCHLFLKGYHNSMPEKMLEKTMDLIKNNSENIVADHVKYALAILHKILINKNAEFLQWKERIIKEIPITCLISYIRGEDGKKLQYGVLLLINTIIRLCKGEQKKQFVKEMNLNKNREYIYNFIITSANIDKKTEHELYVLQTYILSLYEEALNSTVSLDDNSIFKREEFELPDDDVRRLTLLLDFDEVRHSSRCNSFENLLTYHQAERFSLASIVSDKSQDSRKSSTVCTPRIRHQNTNFEYENLTINYLTLEALSLQYTQAKYLQLKIKRKMKTHYKNNHRKNFYQSQIEERVYEPGIFVTSERVVKILADLLDIGLDPPNSKSVFYQPIVFNTTAKNPFFLELFSRTMWLLSRTRREMKVSTIEDYSKLMRALKKQIKMVLSQRPLNFKTLTSIMTETNFNAVMKQWQKEKDEELNDLLNNHPCIKELKEIYLKQNEPFVQQNRLNTLKKGDYFPKVLDKKISGNMFVQLSKNERELYIFDLRNNKKDDMHLKETIKTADITHVATGMNCKHKNLCKSTALAFSIFINHSESEVHFIAEDENMASWWTDALDIIRGNSRRSKNYEKELETLTEMDLKLQLIELQNISIPKNPPLIPSLPKPLLPPKPEVFAKRERLSRRLPPNIPIKK